MKMYNHGIMKINNNSIKINKYSCYHTCMLCYTASIIRKVDLESIISVYSVQCIYACTCMYSR